MKKRTLSLALAAAMAVSLAGCGSSSSGTADKPAETKSAEAHRTQEQKRRPVTGNGKETLRLSVHGVPAAEPTPHSGHLLPLLKKSLAYP